MAAASPQPGRVLVVDDDEGMREFLAELLEDRGHRVTQAADAASARAAYSQEAFDVVVTDLRLGTQNGFDLLSAVREHDPRVAVLVITAYGSIESAVRAIQLGAADYLTKPFEPAAFVLAVDKCMRDHALRQEVFRLRQGDSVRSAFEGIVSSSVAMQGLLEMASRVADTPATILITGPSGAGKEVLARALHRASERRDGPFVAVNCAAIPDALLESELFGHARGAFTGAVTKSLGLFREAHGGTLFLDEIGDLPLALQAKLLRVLQDREVRPLGAARAEPVDVRVMAATHRDLRAATAERTFREDLYYRLAVIELHVPGLRDRRDDVLPLAEQFLRSSAARARREIAGFTAPARRLLVQYAWPGNVRELQNVVERAAMLARDTWITPEDLPAGLHAPPEADLLGQAAERGLTVAELETEYARRVLVITGGNKKEAARRLGISRRTLYRWLGERDDAEEPADDE